MNNIGLQLYTVRSEMEKDFEGTIARVAEIGYKEVEFAGYFGYSPKDVRAILTRQRLAAPATHVSYEYLGDRWSEVVEMCQLIGHNYVVIPGIDEAVLDQPDGWRRVAETFNRAGEICRKAGIQLAYHNHEFEFVPVNGKVPYDILLEECDSALVKMEMDLCWIIVGGHDPITYFHRYPGRFPLVHVKDFRWKSRRTLTGGEGTPPERSLVELTEAGSGSIAWKSLFATSGEAGIQHYFVEHDNPVSPFESIKASYDYLQRLSY